MNKVTFGLTNVHYAMANQTTDGSWLFQKPIRLYGAQEFSAELIGGSSQVHADDQVLSTLISYSGSTITLKMTEIDEQFKKDVFGYKEDEKGNLIEITNTEVKTFALGYEIQGDNKARRIWYFLCTATPVGSATKTKSDSVEANSISLTITARPIEVGDKLVLRRIAKVGDANYSTFLTEKPELPTFGGV